MKNRYIYYAGTEVIEPITSSSFVVGISSRQPAFSEILETSRLRAVKPSNERTHKRTSTHAHAQAQAHTQMRQLCLTRYFLLYSTLCGLVLVIVVFYDISLTTAMIVPSFQPLLGELSRFVIPERFSSFCSIDKEELLNESVPQTIVIQQDQQQPQKEDETNWLKFDPNKSTEENYAAENNNDNSINSDMNGFMGRFASVRRRLDYSYHRVYTSERQRLQDRIISGMLDRTQRLACSRQQQYPTAIHDNNQQNDDLPDQWVIFTAGVMGECFIYIQTSAISKHYIETNIGVLSPHLEIAFHHRGR